jgi:WD40 repeat protein
VDDNPDSRFVLSNDSLPELYSVRLHPSGRWLFAGGANGNLILWDFRHIELLLLEKTYQVEPNSDASVTESE